MLREPVIERAFVYTVNSIEYINICRTLCFDFGFFVTLRSANVSLAYVRSSSTIKLRYIPVLIARNI